MLTQPAPLAEHNDHVLFVLQSTSLPGWQATEVCSVIVDSGSIGFVLPLTSDAVG
jgi:hypothetical protein